MDQESLLTLLLLQENMNIINNMNYSDSSDSSDSDDEEDMLSLHTELQILYAVLMASETDETHKENDNSVTDSADVNGDNGGNNIELDDYVERVVPGYSREMFKDHFRIFPETFDFVLATITPGLRAINGSPVHGRNYISERKQLLIALWFMGTPDSYRSVASRFGVGKATAFRALRRVTYAIYCVAPKFITWPKDQEAIDVMEGFEKTCGFPSVIGAIGATHIKIRTPKDDPEAYINQEGFHCMNTQVVCDASSRFMHVHTEEVGSVQDAQVFQLSPVSRFMDKPEEYFPFDSHLIGDTAYNIHEHLMVPFRNVGHLTKRQQNFNECLSATRMTVERAIGSLKMRFRSLLDTLPLRDTTKIPEFISVCCVLHNICLLKDDEMPLGVQLKSYAEAKLNKGNATELGKEKRIKIMTMLKMKKKSS